MSFGLPKVIHYLNAISYRGMVSLLKIPIVKTLSLVYMFEILFFLYLTIKVFLYSDLLSIEDQGFLFVQLRSYKYI